MFERVSEERRQIAIPLRGIIATAEILLPVGVPRATGIRRRVVLGWQLAHPKHGGYHVALPPRLAQPFCRDLSHFPCRRRHAEGIAQARQGRPAILQKTLIHAVQPLSQSRPRRRPQQGQANSSDNACVSFHLLGEVGYHSVNRYPHEIRTIRVKLQEKV